MKPKYFYAHPVMWQYYDEVSNRADDILSKIDHSDVIILDAAWEAFYQFDIWKERYEIFISKILTKTDNIFVIVDENHSDYLEQLSINGTVKVLSIDFFLYRTYKQLIIHNHTVYNKNWNCQNNQFLLLVGRYKNHRSDLMSRVIDKDLIKNALYSLPWNESEFHPPDIKHEYIDKMVQQFKKVVPYATSIDDYCHPFNGMSYNVDWFNASLFRVIVETSHPSNKFSRKLMRRRIFRETNGRVDIDVEVPKFTTEKTWITIANHLPFIMFAENGVLDKLKDYGFKDFTEYLRYPDYNNQPYNVMIDQITDNIKYWLENITEFANDINKDIETNFQILEQVYSKNKNKILEFMKEHELGDDIEYVVNTDFNQYNIAWEAFYRNIKDSSWPDSTLIKDFYTLPEHIKKECLDDILGDPNNYVLQLWLERYNITI